jgi:hemerythrin-like domain-containing protein
MLRTPAIGQPVGRGSSMTPDLAVARLTQEHRVILKVVDGLRRLADRLRAGEAVNVAALRQADAFLGEYADRLHHAKEEDLLFPALIAHGVPQHGCPIDALLHEHQRGRELRGRMAAATELYAGGDAGAAEEIASVVDAVALLYPNHIWKEDEMVFPLVDRLFPDGDRDGLLARFAAADAVMAPEVRRDFEAFADKFSEGG